MDTKISRFIALGLLSGVSCSSYAVGQLVFDASNGVHLVNIVSEAQKQYTELKTVTEKISGLNNRLGGLSGATPELITQINGDKKVWGELLQGWGSSQDANDSLLLSRGYALSGAGQDKAPAMRQFFSQKLYPPTTGPMTFAQVDEIKKCRQKSIETSSLTGLAVSNQQKHSLKITQRKIADLGAEAIGSANIHSDMVINNKLLSVIALELTQQRELMSQQLELMSAVVTHGSSVVPPNFTRTP